MPRTQTEKHWSRYTFFFLQEICILFIIYSVAWFELISTLSFQHTGILLYWYIVVKVLQICDTRSSVARISSLDQPGSLRISRRESGTKSVFPKRFPGFQRAFLFTCLTCNYEVTVVLVFDSFRYLTMTCISKTKASRHFVSYLRIMQYEASQCGEMLREFLTIVYR
jgi:hypothetical protein